MDRLRLVYGRLLSRLPRPVPALLAVLADHQSPGALVDRIASVVVRELGKRQRLLETRAVEARIAEVTDYLEDLVTERAGDDPRWRARWN
jgi:hypothetical protein